MYNSDNICLRDLSISTSHTGPNSATHRCSPIFILSTIIIIWRVRAARESGLWRTVTTTYAGHCLDSISLIWFSLLIDWNWFNNQTKTVVSLPMRTLSNWFVCNFKQYLQLSSIGSINFVLFIECDLNGNLIFIGFSFAWWDKKIVFWKLIHRHIYNLNGF